jgi:uncharacterized membrane protein YphA (DoxX/SURF4 family)
VDIEKTLLIENTLKVAGEFGTTLMPVAYHGGIMFSFHGFQKILGILSDFQPPMGSQLWFGGIIELLGGLAVMVGYQTRAAAFLCSGEMAAYLQFHWFQTLSINLGELLLTVSSSFTSPVEAG